MKSRSYPEQGFRASLGILRLSKAYSEEELEKACGVALSLHSYRYSTVKNILKNKSYNFYKPHKQNNTVIITTHENIRGENYYKNKENENVNGTDFYTTESTQTFWDS